MQQQQQSAMHGDMSLKHRGHATLQPAKHDIDVLRETPLRFLAFSSA